MSKKAFGKSMKAKEKLMSEDMKKIALILSFALVVAISLFSVGIAYAGGVQGIGLLGIWFFMTFGIVVVLAQVIPAGILFVAMINGVFTPAQRNERPVEVV
jgi:uncharacterized membrane protein